MSDCPFCGHHVPRGSIFCHFCRKSLLTTKVWAGIGILVLALLVIAGMVSSDFSSTHGDFVTTYNVCSEMTKAHAKFPSSYDDKWTSMNHDLFRSMGIIHVKFSVKNAFGMKIEGDSHCKIINGSLVLTDIQMEDGTRVY